MSKGTPSSTNFADSKPSPFPLMGFHPFSHLHPTRPIKTCPVPFSSSRGNGRTSTVPEAHWPSHLPTCSACSSARWHRATANDSVLFCCTPAFTDSRLFILSNIWACCSAMVLVTRTGIPYSQETPVAYQPHPTVILCGKGRKLSPSAASGFVGAAASQCQLSHSQDKESRETSECAAPKEIWSCYRSKIQTTTNPHHYF